MAERSGREYVQVIYTEQKLGHKISLEVSSYKTRNGSAAVLPIRAKIKLISTMGICTSVDNVAKKRRGGVEARIFRLGNNLKPESKISM